MSDIKTSVSYSFTMRLYIKNKPGMLAKVLNTIADKEGDPGAVDVVKVEGDYKVRDLTVSARDENHASEIANEIKKIEGIKVRNVSDRVFLMHLGGKIKIENKMPVDTRDALSMAYTPGVGRVCQAIAKDKEKAHTLTIKQNSVAVVSDGSAVLGLGNIGPEAAMPVMEGKAMLFKEFGDVDAYPICLDTQDVDEIVKAVEWMSPGFGGINLEDISAPRCFEIENRLKEKLDIPVFHDDQHGTAVVVMAATINSLKLVKKKLEDLRIVVVGAGAAGVAIIKILNDAGAQNILCCDSTGIISENREGLNDSKQWLAENTNPDNEDGSLQEACTDSDLLIGVSGADVIPVEAVEKMAKDPIVFALANPDPEIRPEKIESIARIIATGRSDYPNQINNVLAFPGIFRGALDARASDINEEMKLAAAKAIAEQIDEEDLGEEYIVPSVFNKQVANRVAKAVKKAAKDSGVARK
ncbi:NAD-dependent malic enzyme [Gracilimonas mengyeensis]|uniref:Malate dehydrogenase (Oxaloacetate-decarboxylating) n=1 Tax=Gracilimonas mengyeensis TaxID=1302730 RepID=A0A521C4J7_9BACT|nr:NAD-dependent malic enzyme [Gracilimonas mengyeensis]SMO54372.1 malate dehydrogenase (oxaloacetate-decarboxylating) [Gracilimonas mengyeensis]